MIAQHHSAITQYQSAIAQYQLTITQHQQGIAQYQLAITQYTVKANGSTYIPCQNKVIFSVVKMSIAMVIIYVQAYLHQECNIIFMICSTHVYSR